LRPKYKLSVLISKEGDVASLLGVVERFEFWRVCDVSGWGIGAGRIFPGLVSREMIVDCMFWVLNEIMRMTRGVEQGSPPTVFVRQVVL
jgi:hypothetical protein